MDALNHHADEMIERQLRERLYERGHFESFALIESPVIAVWPGRALSDADIDEDDDEDNDDRDISRQLTVHPSTYKGRMSPYATMQFSRNSDSILRCDVFALIRTCCDRYLRDVRVWARKLPADRANGPHAPRVDLVLDVIVWRPSYAAALGDDEFEALKRKDASNTGLGHSGNASPASVAANDSQESNGNASPPRKQRRGLLGSIASTVLSVVGASGVSAPKANVVGGKRSRTEAFGNDAGDAQHTMQEYYAALHRGVEQRKMAVFSEIDNLVEASLASNACAAHLRELVELVEDRGKTPGDNQTIHHVRGVYYRIYNSVDKSVPLVDTGSAYTALESKARAEQARPSGEAFHVAIYGFKELTLDFISNRLSFAPWLRWWALGWAPVRDLVPSASSKSMRSRNTRAALVLHCYISPNLPTSTRHV